MTTQTSRYKLTYPSGSDLVSQAPAQFKQLAESVESALGEVDDRQTANAVKPVVRSTLAQLAEASAVTGQTGYVTADGNNNGTYIWSGSAWVKLAVASDVSAMRQWVKFGFRMQNDKSFAGLAYGGENRLLYNAALRLIRVELAPFRSTVDVGRFQVYQPSSGTIKPSKSLGIGQAILDGGTMGRELTLNTDGTVSVGPEIKNGNLIHPLPNLIPVPSDVTITATGGTNN
jgi:hypothetical protein|nr:MAG TPA: hypothetical protein [Caudoviricetes sp.]